MITPSLLTRHRTGALLAFLALVAGLGFFATRSTVDNSLEVWFVRDDPAVQSLHRFQAEFGNDEVVVTALHRPGAGLEPARLTRLRRLTEALAGLDGVERCLSLANAPVAVRSGETLWQGALYRPPVDAADVQRVAIALEQSAVAQRFVGKSAETLLVYTWLAPDEGLDQARPQILQRVREAVQAHAAADEEVFHAGFGVMYEAINSATIAEGIFFVGLCYLVIIIALLLLTQRLSWLLLTLMPVNFAIVALLGMMALFDRPITVYTVALPALVGVLGIAHAIHLSSHVTAKAQSLRAAFLLVLTPCLVNTVTTASGFGSLATASTMVTRDFGLFAAVGVVFAFLAFVVCFNFALRYLPEPRSSSGVSLALERGAVGMTRFALGHGRLVLAGVAGVVVVCVIGAAQIRVDTRMIDYLPDGHPYRAHSERVEALSGPYLPLELVVRVAPDADWRTGAFQRQLMAAQVEIARSASVGSVTSIATFLQELGVAWRQEGEPKNPALDSDAAVRQFLLLLELGDEDALRRSYVSEDGSSLRLTLTVPMQSAMELKRTAHEAVAIVQRALGADATVSAGGYLPLHWKMADHVVHDQVRSFSVAFGVIFLIIILALRSWRLCLAAVPANLMPIVVVLGYMGYAGINLDTVTVTTAAAVLGIIVDDTIHILYAARNALQAGVSADEALLSAAETTGKAVFSTSAVFIAGFGVIAASEIYTVSSVGLLGAIAIAAAWLNDLVVLPVTIRLVHRKRR